PLEPEQQFDFVLSNPPYVPREDLDKLPVGVRDYEPKLALDGGPGGYMVLERLLEQVPAHLAIGGDPHLGVVAPPAAAARARRAALGGCGVRATIKVFPGTPGVLKARWQK